MNRNEAIELVGKITAGWPKLVQRIDRLQEEEKCAPSCVAIGVDQSLLLGRMESTFADLLAAAEVIYAAPGLTLTLTLTLEPKLHHAELLHKLRRERRYASYSPAETWAHLGRLYGAGQGAALSRRQAATSLVVIMGLHRPANTKFTPAGVVVDVYWLAPKCPFRKKLRPSGFGPDPIESIATLLRAILFTTGQMDDSTVKDIDGIIAKARESNQKGFDSRDVAGGPHLSIKLFSNKVQWRLSAPVAQTIQLFTSEHAEQFAAIEVQ